MLRKDPQNRGNSFSSTLLEWNRLKNNREMPWKGEKDPYKVWLSEIILQQTRVEQGLSYYQKFVKAFPDIHALANAEDQKVFKLWEGLGYYSRCRNLLATARFISTELQGKFPVRFEEILLLKGVGNYTASAIASFAYNLPHAVVDGNVFRVIARIFGIDQPTDTTEGKKMFAKIADDLLDKTNPGAYNQAIMDFGAVICKPLLPLCSDCPFNNSCHAFLEDRVNELPVKAKKIIVKKRWLNYLILLHEKEVLIHERTARDVWRHLYEFTLLETKKEENQRSILKKAVKENILRENAFQLLNVSPLLKQQLSHQLISGHLITIVLADKNATAKKGNWIKKTALKKYPFPGFINQYLSKIFN